MSDCEMWRSVERIGEIAALLVREGFVDDSDSEDLIATLVRQAGRWGLVPRKAANKFRNQSNFSPKEKRRIVDQYLKIASTTGDPRKRSEKRKALGVSAQSLSRWAAAFYGEQALARLRPPSGVELIVRVLRQRGYWMSMREISEALGEDDPRFNSLSGNLNYGFKTGRVQRRKRSDAKWEYTCT